MGDHGLAILLREHGFQLVADGLLGAEIGPAQPVLGFAETLDEGLVAHVQIIGFGTDGGRVQRLPFPVQGLETLLRADHVRTLQQGFEAGQQGAHGLKVRGAKRIQGSLGRDHGGLIAGAEFLPARKGAGGIDGLVPFLAQIAEAFQRLGRGKLGEGFGLLA